MRNLPMKQVREVLRLYLLANLSARKIQGATGVAKTTIQDYIKRYKSSDITTLEILNSLDDDTLYRKLFGKTKKNSTKSSKIMPDYNYIHQELKCAKKNKSYSDAFVGGV